MYTRGGGQHTDSLSTSGSSNRFQVASFCPPKNRKCPAQLGHSHHLVARLEEVVDEVGELREVPRAGHAQVGAPHRVDQPVLLERGGREVKEYEGCRLKSTRVEVKEYEGRG